MHMTPFLLLTLCLFALFGCNPAATTVEAEGKPSITIDPLSCQAGGVGCDMKWNIDKSRLGFPENIQILINDKKIYDECQQEGNVAVTRTSTAVNIILWNYVRVDGSQDFKFQINDQKDCYSTVEQLYLNAVQAYNVKFIDGQKQVFITL